MASVSGRTVSLEARAETAKGARKSRQTKPARRAIRDTFMSPPEKAICAGSGPAPDEFKLFQKSVKWFLQNETQLGGALSICYSRRTREDEQQRGKPRPRARPGPERGRGAEHDRDRGDRAVRGQFPGDSGDGRAASAHCVAGGSAPGNAGCLRVVRARRRNAESRRHVRLSARGLRSGALGPADVLLIRVANAGAGAAFRGFGLDRFRKICGIFAPLHTPEDKSSFV